MLEPTPLFGGNADFLDTLYEQYLRDPASCDARWRQYFDALPGAPGGEQSRATIEERLAARARQGRPLAPSGAARSADARQAAVSKPP